MFNAQMNYPLVGSHRHMGHRKSPVANHSATQASWKAWRHPRNIRHTTPAEKASRHTAQSGAAASLAQDASTADEAPAATRPRPAAPLAAGVAVVPGTRTNSPDTLPGSTGVRGRLLGPPMGPRSAGGRLVSAGLAPAGCAVSRHGRSRSPLALRESDRELTAAGPDDVRMGPFRVNFANVSGE